MSAQDNFRSLPPLKALKGFEAAARLLSLRLAAEELHLTHAAISHQIRLLEASLGVPLFTRNGRNIELTQHGKQFYPVTRDALEMLVNGAEAIRRTAKPTVLCVQTYVTVSIRWLSRRLTRFRSQYPNLDLKVTSQIVNQKFDEANADVGIIYSQSPPPAHLHWIPIIKPQLFAVCSPQLVGERQGNLQPADLLDYPLITISSEEWQWHDWLEPVGLETASFDSSLVVDTTAAALEMAMDGEGIALVNGPFADGDIEAGRLIRPVEHQVTSPGEWGITCRKDMLEDYRIASFIDWLLDDVARY